MSDHQKRLEGLIKAITAEDMLGGFIRAHLYIEFELNSFLSKRLPEGVLDTLRLEWRKEIDLAITVGLLPGLKVPLRKIGDIRNDFAHNLGHYITSEDVDALLKSFSRNERSIAASLRNIAETPKPREFTPDISKAECSFKTSALLDAPLGDACLH